MNTPYPPSETRSSGWLSTAEGHDVYYEEGGAPDGLPVVFLHGGPGAGCKPSHRQFFDPDRYRSFLVDQRGAGRSRPFGGIEHNTTQHLIGDLERLRDVAGVERWVLFGGSWGAALALAYAERHPERVAGMVLRGSFLARERDLEWFLGDGVRRILPEAWAEFTAAIDMETPDVAQLYHIVTGSDAAAAERMARAWMQWSTAVVMFALDTLEAAPDAPAGAILGKARIEVHYARHRYFLAPDELLRDAGRLPRVPTTIIHGARDLTCPAESAWALHQAMPGSRLVVLRTAGHLSGEPAMSAALVEAADDMARQLA